MNIRFPRTVGLLVATAMTVATVTVVTPGTALADGNDTVTTAEVAATLNNVDPNLIADAVPSTPDADSAAVTSQGDITIDVAKNPEEGVSVTSESGVTATIDLPHAEDAGDARKLADGTVVYSGTDGTANGVTPAAEGPQMTVTITNPDAPINYDYGVDVTGGGSVEYNDGSPLVFDTQGNVVLAVPSVWARDAND